MKTEVLFISNVIVNNADKHIYNHNCHNILDDNKRMCIIKDRRWAYSKALSNSAFVL